MSFIIEDIRLTMLRLMDKNEGAMNNAVLHVGVRRFGHRIGLDVIAQELDWLSGMSLSLRVITSAKMRARLALAVILSICFAQRCRALREILSMPMERSHSTNSSRV